MARNQSDNHPAASAVAHFANTPTLAGLPEWYPRFLESVAEKVSSGRTRMTAAANQEFVATYWAIGCDIRDRQAEQGWGTKVIDRLSADLRDRFPEAKGFSPRNLKYMRKFAQLWDSEAIVQAPLAQLPWYHQIALMEKLDGSEERL